MLATFLNRSLVSQIVFLVVLGGCLGTLLGGCGQGSNSSENVSSEATTSESSSNRAGAATTQALVQTLPPIRITPGILDWGDVIPGSTSEGSVSLTNLGTAPVKIITVQPGCKCTTTTGLDGVTIGPGESRDLVASLDAQPAPGTRNVQIKVLFEGYAKPLEINGTAAVTHPVRVRPPYINAVDETKSTGTLMLSAGDQVPFKVLSVDGRTPRFIRKDMAGDPKVNHIISYDINDHLEADGRYRRWVVVETDHPTAPLIEVLLRHRNTSLDVSPGFKQGAYHFNMGRIEPGGSVELSHLTHDATSTGPIGMILAEQEGVGMEILSQEIDDDTDDLSVKIRVDIAPDMAEGFYYFPVRIYAANQVDVILPGFVSVRAKSDLKEQPQMPVEKSIQQ
jgi:hypothetical protein